MCQVCSGNSPGCLCVGSCPLTGSGSSAPERFKAQHSILSQFCYSTRTTSQVITRSLAFGLRQKYQYWLWYSWQSYVAPNIRGPERPQLDTNSYLVYAEPFIGHVLEDVAVGLVQDFQADGEVMVLQRAVVVVPDGQLGL